MHSLRGRRFRLHLRGVRQRSRSAEEAAEAKSDAARFQLFLLRSADLLELHRVLHGVLSAERRHLRPRREGPQTVPAAAALSPNHPLRREA